MAATPRARRGPHEPVFFPFGTLSMPVWVSVRRVCVCEFSVDAYVQTRKGVR